MSRSLNLLTLSMPTLTPEDHAHFLEHGYVVIKRAVPPETIAAAVRALEADADSDVVPNEAVAACLTDTVLDAVGELFGPAYPFTRSRQGVDIPRPHELGKEWTMPRAHLGDVDPTLMPDAWALGTLIFLTPLQPHGGAFVVFDGSHRRYQELISATPGTITKSAADARYAHEGQEFLAEPGDVLLFHPLLGLADSPNVSDPRTRHVLWSRWRPLERIVPGGKPLDALSTIEKVNSVRFLSACLGAQFAFPRCRAEGPKMPRLPGGALAHALIHFGGETRLFCVAGAEPGVVLRARSTDLWDWQWDRPLPPAPGPLLSLAFHQRGPGAILLAGVADDTQILASRDFDDWTPVANVVGARQGVGRFRANDGRRTIRGQMLFCVPCEDSRRVCCRWAPKWAGLGAAANEATVAAAPVGCRILGLCIAPVLGEQRFGLVVDVAAQGTFDSRPFYALSEDAALYPEPRQALVYTAPTAPRGLQVYARAREFWLCTYVRREDGEDCLFWGVVDWTQTPVTLREITEAAVWQQALETVGLR